MSRQRLFAGLAPDRIRPAAVRTLRPGALPADPEPGVQRISVRETDMFGAIHRGERLIRIE